MKSTSFTIQELKKLDSLYATITGFLKLPKWTIATGAMLISGVQPVPLAISVPEEACQLSDPISLARPSQLRGARAVMKDWAECHEDEDGSSSEMPIEEEPISFLIWCEEEYRGSLRRPVFLDLFLVLAGFENATPVQQNVVTRLLELEQHAAVEIGRQHAFEIETPSPDARRPSSRHFAKRMEVLIENGKIKLPIATDIAAVLDETAPTGILQPGLVWSRLLKMAQSEDYPSIQSTGPDTLEIPKGKRSWKPYTLKALGQFLRRNRELLLGVEEGNSQ